MTSIHFTRNLNTATVGQSLKRPVASAQPTEFLRSMLGSYVYDISETLLKLAELNAILCDRERKSPPAFIRDYKVTFLCGYCSRDNQQQNE